MNEETKIATILYVEDESNIRVELAEFLEIFCDELLVANNGAQGLELYKHHLPWLVISDVRMPVMDGIEMASSILAINPQAHIIFTTAFSDTDYMQKAISLHADAYLIKPIDLVELEQVIKQAINTCLLESRLKEKTDTEKRIRSELEVILATMQDGVALIDKSLQCLFTNQAFDKLTEFSTSELNQLNVLNLIKPLRKNDFEALISKIFKKGVVGEYETELVTKSGAHKFVHFDLARMPDTRRILLVARDISYLIHTQSKMQEYIGIIDRNVITTSTDLKGNITYVSEAYEQLSHYSKNELMGKKHKLLRDPAMPAEVYQDLWKTIIANQVWTGEISNIKKNGDVYWVKTRIYPSYDEYQNKIGYTAVMSDITSLKRIKELSITDELTGLYNRRHFNAVFEQLVCSAKRHHHWVCFAILDIDFFKLYNDNYGHQAGDIALKQVAASLKKTLKRSDDYCFRLGGEEFAVLYIPTEGGDPVGFAKNLLAAIENLHIPHAHSKVSEFVTLSMGQTVISADKIQDLDRLYRQTDELLYQAKSQGRNRVVSVELN